MMVENPYDPRACIQSSTEKYTYCSEFAAYQDAAEEFISTQELV